MAASVTQSGARDGRRAHRRRLAVGFALAVALVVGLAANGAGYYMLPTTERPHSPAHAALRPSGTIGLKLGFLGLAMFLTIFLYAVRRRVPWLARLGSSSRWLDYHVLLGATAPFVIALHASFKFRGLAGMAFWIMVAVALSGVIGRYLYAQIPRRLAAAELSLREVKDQLARSASLLGAQRVLPADEAEALLSMPSPERVRTLSMVGALAAMVALDARRALRIARLRRRAVTGRERLLTLGGLRRTTRADLEHAIDVARREAATAKQVVFLARAQQVFHLWHVVHRPFSYSFALLAAIHVLVVMAMGYF